MGTFTNVLGNLVRSACGIAGALFLATSAAGSAQAVTFSEPFPDAGETLSTAAVVGSAPFGTPLDAISGAILNPSGGADLYQIYLPGASFSADTNASGGLFSLGDSQLFLFDADGVGVFWDDDSGTNLKSAFTLVAPTAGIYYLGISGYNYDPLSTGGRIFSGNGGGPTGPGGADPLTGWALTTGDTAATGRYAITLTGATFVPEPGSVAGLLVLAGLGCGAAKHRRRPVVQKVG